MDTENLLRLLKENAVEFVIIGASAFPVHGYSRATLDKEAAKRPRDVDDLYYLREIKKRQTKKSSNGT